MPDIKQLFEEFLKAVFSLSDNFTFTVVNDTFCAEGTFHELSFNFNGINNMFSCIPISIKEFKKNRVYYLEINKKLKITEVKIKVFSACVVEPPLNIIEESDIIGDYVRSDKYGWVPCEYIEATLMSIPMESSK